MKHYCLFSLRTGLYPTEKFKFYIMLSTAIMNTFGRDCKQVAANEAIMFKPKDHYYKVPVCMSDFHNLVHFFDPHMYKFNNLIELMEVPNLRAFKYLTVKHHPLSQEEAKLCLGIDRIDYVNGIGNRSCEQYICIERRLVPIKFQLLIC